MPVPENAGFESPADADQIPGWTATAAAGSSVAIDGAHKHEGARSLRLASTGQPASIASAPFDPPTTGRVAIDLWLRAGERGLPSVRIALEGQQSDGKFDAYGMIPPVAPAGAPGRWVQYSFRVDDVPSEGLSNVRVRLDVLGPGEVWVDDLKVFDLPFTDPERFELSKLISLASVKLEAGQLADCERLLEGYWPQFLLANVPLVESAPPIVEHPATGTPAEAPKPGMLESLKDYLPRLPRR
jgi:hypothetical protein